VQFFEPKILEYFQDPNNDFDDFAVELKTESFNLFTLYQKFVDERIEVYFKDKCMMDLSSPMAKRNYIRMKKEILKNLETIAVQQILKTGLQKHLPSFKAGKFDEEQLEDLTRVGLIYEVDQEMKFVHQTYGDFGFNNYLKGHFDDEDCSEFIDQVVLVDDSYQIIRSFMDCWILEKMNETTLENYGKYLLNVKDAKRTPFHVAGREGNEKIIAFLYRSLIRVKKLLKK
jgi:hypothetical protein